MKWDHDEDRRYAQSSIVVNIGLACTYYQQDCGNGGADHCFKALKKWQNKFDFLVNEMLLIKQLWPCLNVQSDLIRAKVFVQLMQTNNSGLLVTLEIAYLI